MAGGWLGSSKKPRITLVVGDRAMATNWARNAGVDPKYVVATTEGHQRLRGLGYVPTLIEGKRIPKHVLDDRRHQEAMEGWAVLNSMFGKR